MIIPKLNTIDKIGLKRRIELNKLEQARKTPLTEHIDVRTTAQTILLTEPFVVVNRVSFAGTWSGDFIFANFLGEGAPLTVPLKLNYGKRTILAVSANHQFYHNGASVTLQEDDTAAGKIKHLSVMVNFYKWMPMPVFPISNNRFLEIIVGEDMSAMGNEIDITFFGWGYI